MMTALEEIQARRQALQRDCQDCWICQRRFILSYDDWERLKICHWHRETLEKGLQKRPVIGILKTWGD